MAELGPEGLDDFQDRIDELGDYLFTTLTNSVEAAAQSANLSAFSKNLTVELSKGLLNVQVDKILTDKLLKDTKVQKVMADVQKKFEDGVSKINFKVNNIQLPTEPLFVDIKANNFDTTGLAKALQVPVVFNYEKLLLPKAESVEVPVEFLYDKFQLPKTSRVLVNVKYAYEKFIQPKASDLEVSVSYLYDKFTLPKSQKIGVPVEYEYEKLALPRVTGITIPVGFNYDKFALPKAQSLDVFVDYVYDKFILPKATPVSVQVKYAYEKFILPKVNDLSVSVKYLYDKFALPKINNIQVPVSFAYDDLSLPKESLDVPVHYKYDKLVLPKSSPINVLVGYVYDKFTIPKPTTVNVPVKYSYDKFTLPINKSINVAVEYVYSKLSLPKSSITVPVDYQYESFKLPKDQVIDVFVDFIYTKFELPKVNPVNVAVKYAYDKFVQPLVSDISVSVKYVYDKFTLPKISNVVIPVVYDYDDLIIPKSQVVDVFVDYVYTKFELPKAQQINIPVAFNYAKFTLPKAGSIDVAVEYIYDKFQLPKAIPIKVPVSFIYDKFALPKASMITVPVSYDYEDYTQPEVEDVSVSVSYDYDKLILPKSQVVDVFVDFVYSKLQLPKASKIQVPVEYKYQKPVEQKKQQLTVQVKYSYDKFIAPVVKAITVPVKYLYDKFQLPKVGNLTVNVQPITTELDALSDVGLTAKVTEFDTNLIQQTIQSLDPININATTAPLSSFATLTTTVSDAGNAAASLVNLIDQANKKAAITVDLYNKIKDAADQLVAAKKMERDSADAIIKSLQSKLKLPTTKLSAKVTDVNTSKIDKALESYKPAQLSAIMNLESSSVDKLQNMAPAQVPVTVTDVGTITTAIKDAILEAANSVSEMFSGIESGFGDALAKGFNKGKNKIKGATLLDTITAEIKSYEKAQDDAALKGKILTLMADKTVSSERAALMIALDAQKQKLESLATQQKALLTELNIAKAEANRASNLEEVAKLQEEILQAQSDLTGYKNEIALLNIKGKKLDDMISSQESLTAAAAEEKRIKEKISEIYEKHFDIINEIKSVSAQVKDVFKSQELALATLAGSAAVLGHRLTYSMHDFKSIGMDAATAVQASFNSLSIKSIMGLSDTVGVTKQLVSEFGSLNTLTTSQVDAVGQLAHNNGMAGEEAASMVMAMSRMPGMTKEMASNSEEMFKQIGKTKGVIPAQIMKEVAKNSSLMATYSRGGAKGFIEAAASAKKMGVELGNMLGAARKTLDFESSINAEMEASALLGRSMNFDSLRRAALSGDANAILREQTRLIQQAGGLDRMNVLQKEKLAEAMGMSVDEMVKMSEQAKYQEEHFGEQASIWAKITGYTAKYTEGLINGFTQIAPLATGLASIMSLLNAKSLPGMVKSVWTMVKGLTAGVFQAGLLLLKFIAIGALKLFKADTWTGMAKGIRGAVDATKGFTFQGAIKGLTTVKDRLKELVMSASSDKVKEALSGGGVSGPSFADKRKMVLERRRAGGGLSPATPPSPPTGGVGPTDQADKISKINAASLLKGAAAMLVAAAAIYVFAKAVQELDKVKNWKTVAIGLGLFAGAMAITALILSKAGPGIAIASLALIPFGLALMMFAKAISIAAPAIAMLGAAFGSFVTIVSKNIGGFIAVALGLPLLAAGITMLGIASIFALPAAGALTILGIGIAAFGKLAGVAAPGIVAVATSLAVISKVNSSNFKNVGDGLFHIAKGLGAIAFTGLAAVPVLTALSKLNMVAPQAPQTPIAKAAPVGAKTTQPAVQAMAPAPAAAVGPAVGSQATTSATKSAKESSQDISILVGKLTELISVLKAGGTINVDGKKLASIVLSNIRGLIYTD